MTSLLTSLLFFKELETNRKLEETVLKYETSLKLAEQLRSFQRSTTNDTPSVAPPTPKAIDNAPTIDEQTEGQELPRLTTTPTSPPQRIVASLTNLNIKCEPQQCVSKISLMPSTTGLAEGSLLLVLETEIPRIGTSTPTSNIRKRYFIYPGNTTRETLTPKELTTLPHKSFKLTRALPVIATFKFEKFLNPIALNLYLFDSKGNTIRHVRQPLDERMPSSDH